MSAPLPLCIVGAGLIGARHVEVAQATDRVRLTAVVERDTARLAALAAEGLPVVAALEDVPKDTRAAVIATPTPAHEAGALAALARGMAVLVEKPVAGTLGAARRVAVAADGAGLPLVVGHHRRCHPFTIAARDMARDLGPLVAVQGFWSLRKPPGYFDLPWRRGPGAGPLMTNFSHEADLMQFLVGPVKEVTALTSAARRGLEVEDSAALAFRFENGALGSFAISDAGASPWAFEAASGENPGIAASGEDYLRLTGEAGALAFPSLTRWGGGDWSAALERHRAPEFARIDPLAAQMARFAALVGGGEDDVLATAAEGIAALEIVLAAALSAAEARPVALGTVPEEFNGGLS